jgi:hypothetical protein
MQNNLKHTPELFYIEKFDEQPTNNGLLLFPHIKQGILIPGISVHDENNKICDVLIFTGNKNNPPFIFNANLPDEKSRINYNILPLSDNANVPLDLEVEDYKLLHNFYTTREALRDINDYVMNNFFCTNIAMFVQAAKALSNNSHSFQDLPAPPKELEATQVQISYSESEDDDAELEEIIEEITYDDIVSQLQFIMEAKPDLFDIIISLIKESSKK